MSNIKWTSPTKDDKYDDLLKKGRPALPPMTGVENTIEKESPVTHTNIKYISNSVPIEVTPPEIIINDIEPNQTYEVVVLVRNLTNVGRRIRVYQPKTNKFRCDYDMQGNVAAGLAMKLVVSFETDKNGDFHDVLEIVSDNGFSQTVALHAFQPQATIAFDPFINFGFIKIMKEEVRPILFENQGKKEGKVDLRFDGVNDMAIQPSNFLLKPGERKQVFLKYNPKEAGIFRGVIEVTVEGQSLLKHIDVSATSVDYFIFMVDKNGAQSQNFDFGDIYFGQFKEIEGYLVNNSPQKFNFKAKFLTGLQNNAGDLFSLQTPFDLGQEQVQRIMTCSPEEGVIDSYSQVPIKFSCKSRVSEDMIFWTRNYCMRKERYDDDKGGDYSSIDQRFEPTNYSYTCIFEFDGKNDMSPYIHLSAKGICPTVKISHHLINFGECKVHDRRDYLVTLENKNDDHAVDFSFANVAHFRVAPKTSKLQPHGSQQIVVSFEPKSLGKFSNSMDLELFGIYKIPIKLVGTSLSISQKKFNKRGPESVPEDFQPDRKFVTDDNIDYGSKRVKKGDNRLIFQTTLESTGGYGGLEGSNISEKLDLYYSQKNNKEKYNTFIKDQRQKRLDKPRELERNQKFDVTNEKLEELLPNREFFGSRDKEDRQILHPFDFDFIFGTQSIPMDRPKYALPDPHDPLFVTKPIGRYEPGSSSKIEAFTPDPTKTYKKMFPSEPNSQAEYRDIMKELNAEELQKVFVGPTTIDFGIVYVKSRVSKFFAVKNQLKTAIVVQISSNNGELSESYQKPQIIPPMQVAGFEVCFYSQNLQSFKGSVKYTINGRHEFYFAVNAQVEPVKLLLETNNMAFRFQEKDEEMEILNTITINNKGNAPGKFNWELAQNSVFKISPMKGEVPADSSTKVSIVYKPSGNNFKGESEKLTMQVENGENQYLNCTGYVNEAKCEFRETAVDFGNVLVSQEQPKAVYLKNKHKTTAVFKISPRLPPGITVSPMSGRIPPDSHVELRVAVFSNEERNIADDIVVDVRGGKSARLPVKARVIIPQVKIVEEDFDFGGITYGSTATLKMTLVNGSNLTAVLNVDMTNEIDYPGIQFLQIMPESEPNDEDSTCIMSVNQENDPNNMNDDREASLSMADSDEEEEEKEPMRCFNIKVKENGELHFLLKFTPNDAKSYNFELPIRLQGYGKIEGLTRFISCRGLRPRCILDPPTLEFKKKTITSFEKPLPDFEKVVLSNMDLTKTIVWKFDTKIIDEERAFTIQPTQGRIEPGQQQIITVGFSPNNPGQYEKVVPFYLDNDMSKPYGNLTLKGMGDFPKLLFDRREIILPIVPLDVESRCAFKIINDGYENLTLKYEIANDVGNIDKNFLNLEFPEGKNLGVTKPKLKVEAVFRSKKPLSFTVELNFIDDNKHVYRIRISATTDNCLFTNFPYMQRNFGEFEILAPENKPIILRELDNDDSELSPKAFSMGVSKTGSTTSRAGKSLLGYSPIPQRELEKACENIKNWLNQNVLASYISKFPQDIIESNGSQMFDLIQFLTGKAPAGKANLTLVTKKTEKIKVLHKQYDDLLRVLKENGGLLNTIRPEYLFRHADYNTYIKQQDNQFLMPNLIKLSESKFTYLSTDAWITVFYQILKVYFLGKVNLKTFKMIPGMPPEKLNVPDYYLEGSNVIGVPENLLLRWLEVHYEKMKPGLPKRIKNFGEDLRDGHVFAAVIQSYVGNASKSLGAMRNNLVSKDDYMHNATKIIGALEELGLQTPFTAKDLESPSQREMILFCLYMYNNLPHYIPKATIEFACLLRETAIKYVELTNPAPKAISYRVHLEGDADYSLEGTEDRDTNVHLEPKTSVRFPIKYTARLSKPVTGRILFTNKREEGNIQAAALVFDLKSKVTGRVSVSTETIQARLYELKQKDLRIENPFNQKADFQIEFIYQKNVAAEPDKKKRNFAASTSSKNKGPIKPETKVDDFFMPFSCRHTTVTVPRLGSTTVPITFLPFTMETHMCYLVLRDDKAGEIQYTLTGEVDFPASVEIQTPGTFYLENEQRFSAPIPINNNTLYAARKSHIDRLPQAQRAKELEKEKALRQYEKTFETVNYEIEYQSQFLMIPHNFTIHTGNKQKAEIENKKAARKKNETSFDSRLSQDLGASLLGSIAENKLNIGLNFKTPTKDHSLKFVMKSQNKLDIRVYEIKVTVLPKPIRSILEMRCPAGDSLTQDIPLKNDSDRDWTIKVQLMTDTGRNGNFFSGGHPNKEFRVPKNSTGSYPIVFRPPWILTAEAKLSLTNTYNNQQYDFELKGIGEEPLAEGHVILDCKARKTRSYVFKVKNDLDRKVTYRVETDLYNASGKSNFEVAAGKTEEYQLDVTPMLGGAYTGSITFYDDAGRYKWWTVEVHTESPKAEKAIDLVTVIRKAIAFDLTITNPLDKRVTFEVILTGEGLFGENAFTLLPKQTGVYELVFSPLKAMKQSGSIAFVHEDLGELWYELNLQADDSQSVRLSTLRAELGKAEYHEVELENPTNKEVSVRPRLSNPHNFDILPENLVIPPYDSIVAQIRYMPSDLDIIESCEVVFETDEIGKWSYLAFGQGIPPTKFDIQTISGALNRDSSAIINFKNPFKDAININITLEATEENQKAFDILLKKTKLSIGGLNVIQIPVSFLPRAISDYYAEIVIQMNEKISWRYPIRGVTESLSLSSDYFVKTKCRSKYETELKIVLPGNSNANPDDTYTLELMNVPKEYEKILQNSTPKALTFTPIRNTIKNPGDALIFKATFQPLKPFKTAVDFAIVKSTGGRWKYKLYLESTMPDPDDTITITSPINKTSSVSFKLTNYNKQIAEFTSGFTADSDSEFTIHPKNGILEPYGKEREGTNFIISFTPVEYGKIKLGKLIIQTDEMFWSYNIRGVFPKYVVPKVSGSRIQNKLSDNVAKQLSAGKMSRNFLIENIRKSSHSPVRKNKENPRSRSGSRSASRSRSPQKDTLKEKTIPSVNVLPTPKATK